MAPSSSPPTSPSPAAASSSPGRPDSYGLNGRKERGRPSITPRKFTRFFTPRSHGSLMTRSSRRALFDITRSANNHNGSQSSPLRPLSSISTGENSPTSFTRDMKRRKLIHCTSLSPDNPEGNKSSSSGRILAIDGEIEAEDDRDNRSSHLSLGIDGSEKDVSVELLPCVQPLPKRIKRIGDRGIVGELVELSLSNSSTTGRRHLTYPTPGQ